MREKCSSMIYYLAYGKTDENLINKIKREFYNAFYFQISWQINIKIFRYYKILKGYC